MNLKPDISDQLKRLPIAGAWISLQYELTETPSDLLDLFHLFKNEVDKWQTPELKKTYNTAANIIYSLLTGKTYESKIWI